MGIEISLKDKVALITGSRRGLGRAMALRFAEAGADVVVNDVVAEDGQLSDTAAEIRRLGRRSTAVQADVSNKKDVEGMIEQTLTEFGRIDILVNNAVIGLKDTVVNLQESDWDRAVGIGLKGPFLCSQAAGRRMMEQKNGCIINIASIRAFRPKAGFFPYGLIKGGMVLLTKQLTREMSDFNIRANAIAPGYVKTELTQYYWQLPDQVEAIRGEIPFGHQPGEPIDIANAALFLASDLARYITGHTLVVDGGVLSGHPVVPYRLREEVGEKQTGA